MNVARRRPHELPSVLRLVTVIHAQSALHGHRDLHCAAHGVDGIAHHFRPLHERTAELALGGHAAGGASHIQIHLIVAIALHGPRGIRQFAGVAAPQLANDGVLLLMISWSRWVERPLLCNAGERKR